MKSKAPFLEYVNQQARRITEEIREVVSTWQTVANQYKIVSIALKMSAFLTCIKPLRIPYFYRIIKYSRKIGFSVNIV